AEGLPLVFDKFDLVGHVPSLKVLADGTGWKPSDPPSSRRQEMPIENAVVSFPSELDAKSSVQSHEKETTMSQKGHVIGVGGIFFKSSNPQQAKEWYAKHLGFADSGYGVMLPWREKDNPESEHVTAWSVFPESTKYFEPSHASFMLNYIVDDLDAL